MQAWLVCDHDFMRHYGLGAAKPAPMPLAPMLANGYLQCGRTLAELASACGIDADALQQTAQRYNAMALVGKAAGLSERALADLALGALAHDAGKTEIPVQILKSSQRKKHEEDFFRQHVGFSTQFAAQSGAFSPQALAIIEDHHEAVDGTGWPRGKKDASPGARILAMVDRYDRLCSPEATDREALMPAEALATMFRHEGSKFDAVLLRILIRLLGVYPPGTVVQLNDGSLALVVSPGAQSLQPKVLIYSPELSKDDAPTLELATEPSLKIVEAIRPGTLPPDVLTWLNPQQRLSYFYSVGDVKT